MRQYDRAGQALLSRDERWKTIRQDRAQPLVRDRPGGVSGGNEKKFIKGLDPGILRSGTCPAAAEFLIADDGHTLASRYVQRGHGLNWVCAASRNLSLHRKSAGILFSIRRRFLKGRNGLIEAGRSLLLQSPSTPQGSAMETAAAPAPAPRPT